MRGSVFCCFALLLTVCQMGVSQDVVSASSGVLHYFEGTVILDGKSVEHKAAVFPSLANGSTLQTEKGKAELLLTPGVYLRLDDTSAVKMLSNSLKDTRVELTRGSSILDTLNAPSGDKVVLAFEGSEVHFSKPGIFRIDSDVGELQVYSGECSVTHRGTSTTVDSSHLYYFALNLTTNKFGEGATDEFYDWASNRGDVIADQNQLASAEGNNPLDADPGSGGGMYVIPPIYSSPSYATPATPMLGYSPYDNSGNPFYLYQRAPYSLYGSSLGIIVLPPYRHRPGVTRWPVTTAPTAFRPGSGVTHWPTPARPVSGIISSLPGSGIRFPVQTPILRPGGPTHVTAPSIAVHPSAPHFSAPHIGAVGHR